MDQIIQKYKDDLIKGIKKFPRNTVEYLFHSFEPLKFEIGIYRQIIFSNWQEFILSKVKVFHIVEKLFKLLEGYNLSINTPLYVTTNYGETRNKYILIANEIKDFLIINKIISIELDYQIKNQLKLFYLLHRISIDLARISDREVKRRNYWSLLQELQLTERDVKNIIDKFQRENITSDYKELLGENFLFDIKDINRYNILIDKMLEDILFQIPDQISFSRLKFDSVLKTKINPLLKEHAKSFTIIANFELKLRNYILKKMQDFGQDWYDKLKEIKIRTINNEDMSLYDLLESRKQEDVNNRILPEQELLFYADIIHYKEIILKFWDTHFKKDFSKHNITKEKIEHALNEINKVRRQTMHLRELKQDILKTIYLFIIPEFNKIIDT